MDSNAVHGADASRRTRRPPPRPGLDIGGMGSDDNGRRRRDQRRRTQKTSERVAISIVRDIVARGLGTGDRLPLEAAMVEHYGVSRASLREALRLLEVQGLIRLKPGPGGGPVVGTVEPAHLASMSTLYFHLGGGDYGHLLQVQVMLEPLCAQLAARHPDRAEVLRPFTDPEAHDHLEEERYRSTTRDLHAAVYQLAANPVLTLLTEAVTTIVTEHVVANMDPVEMRPAILHEHTAIAGAIVAGDEAEAMRLMAEHFENQHDYYRSRSPERLDDLIEWR